MTDKARELLERVIAETDSSHFYTSEIDKEIRAFLSTPQPEQDEEPVAWMKEDEDGDLEFNTLNQFSCGRTNGIPLYLRPAPRKPFVRLSEEEVSEILSSAHTPYEAVCATENRLKEKNR